MPQVPTPTEPTPSSGPDTRGLASRLFGTAKAVITVEDNLRRIEKDDTKLQARLSDLTKLVFELSRQVSDVSGQMKTIEKRLENRDRLVEMTIRLRIVEEAEKLRAEFRSCGRSEPPA